MPIPAVLKIDKLARVQIESNEHLQSAMMSERAQSWNKVVERYKRLLRLISKSNLPGSFIPTPNYNMLVYESYYHLGMALQNLGRHKEAIIAYSNAMMSMDLRKNGCTAGCNSNTCFHTPVLAKRALAHAKTGDIKNAFRDIEKAVVLDTHNPDLYCVRALMWSTKKEAGKAVEDLDRAISFNKRHACAHILRGTINQPMMSFGSLGLLRGFTLGGGKKELAADHKTALQINQDAAGYLDVADVHHPRIIHFWNRFLWSLNVPRTITYIDLTSPIIAHYNTTIVTDRSLVDKIPRQTSATPLVPFANHQQHEDGATTNTIRPNTTSAAFRCGTPQRRDDHLARHRRISYGEAIRSYTAQQKETGISEYIQHLVAHATRPNTAHKAAGGEKSPEPPAAVISRSASRTESAIARAEHDTAPTPAPSKPPLARRSSQLSVASCPIPFSANSASARAVGRRCASPAAQLRASSASQLRDRRRTSLAAASVKSSQSVDAALQGIKVFTSVNVKEVPRMYYKPWVGDKLPVAERPSFPRVEAFRV